MKVDLKAVCFDLDGVLIPDSPRWHQETFNQVLEEFNLPPVLDEDYHGKYLDLGTREKLKLLVNLYDKGDIIQRAYNRRQELVAKVIEEKCIPSKQIINLVDYAASKYQVCVVTNCIRSAAFNMLDRAGLLNKFSFILTGDDFKEKKPAPEPYKKAVEALDLEPLNCLAIEDTDRGAASSLAAGLLTWYISGPDRLIPGGLDIALSILSNSESKLVRL